MTEKISVFVLKQIAKLFEMKWGSVTFYVADGKIVDVEFNQKVSREEIQDAQK